MPYAASLGLCFFRNVVAELNDATTVETAIGLLVPLRGGIWIWRDWWCVRGEESLRVGSWWCEILGCGGEVAGCGLL